MLNGNSHRLFFPLAALGLALFLSTLACSDDNQPSVTPGEDAAVIDQSTQADTAQPETDKGPDPVLPDLSLSFCKMPAYPVGPYGVRTNDVADNMEFIGYADPQEHCKANEDKALDMNQQVRINFRDWYQGLCEGDCASFKKDLLWVIVSAGWCGPCRDEVEDIQSQYGVGKVNPRLGILNIVFETGVPGRQITDAYLREKWIDELKLTFPVVMDPEFKMGLYFNKAATPFNMLLDLNTMKIYHQQVGGDLTEIRQAMDAFFKQ